MRTYEQPLSRRGRKFCDFDEEIGNVYFRTDNFRGQVTIVSCVHRKGPKDNDPWQRGSTSFLVEHKILHRLNHTVALPTAFNTVDGQIEGEINTIGTDDKTMRPKILKMLDKLSTNDQSTPEEELKNFIQELQTTLTKLQKNCSETGEEKPYIEAHLLFLENAFYEKQEISSNKLDFFFKKCVQELKLQETTDWNVLRKFLIESDLCDDEEN
ncbi:MAG: hypothetical protein JSR80_03815 [Verrucomicrobia bacterium]|nr:hypothetical protein [Verrucomicrobiota bacterium]